jgi:hypothetical protein
MRRRRLFCLAAATLVLLTAGAAQAAPTLESKTNSSAGKSSAGATAEHRGGLPFSGLDLALLAAGAGPLVLLGMSARRRRPKPAVQPAQEETLTLA